MYAALPGVAMTKACAADNGYGSTVWALRSPLDESAKHGALLQELVRCATLAANGHNTQPWKFALSPNTISIRPDLSRRTPVVDPDDHHLWVSLGCAAENLVLAAAALGKHADVAFGPQGVHVALDSAAPVRSPLVNAIFDCVIGCANGSVPARPTLLPEAGTPQRRPFSLSIFSSSR